ncbi:MAG: exodeoxyribonuclease VII large subunit [Armatimonadota bacterium]
MSFLDNVGYGTGAASMSGLQVITVNELTRCIKYVFEAEDLFRDVWVQGEVSNLTRHSSGHIYFSLKDASALIRCVIWSSTAKSIKHNIKEGMSLIVHGKISLYERQGQYQLSLDSVMPNGIGDLYVEYEQLKSRLQEEGLFDQQYKKPLPAFPLSIAMITSPTGAVIEDMVSIARRRMPSANLLLIPALVQGTDAPASIVESLRLADTHPGIDVIIMGRGGGSIEDLWAFNSESVVRAVFSCRTPVVSAVGHETDYTLADFAADLRAPTPSAAMEQVLPDKESLVARIKSLEDSISSSVINTINRRKSNLDMLANSSCLKFPEKLIQNRWQTLDLLQAQMMSGYRNILSHSEGRLGELSASLNSLSPLNVLGRGYGVLRKIDGSVIRSISNTSVGEITETLVPDGVIISEVKKIKEGWE